MAVHYAKAEHIVTITIDRYERRNAIDPEHAAALVACWARYRDDDDARVAIITGVRNAFCSGGDLKNMGDIARELAETGRSRTRDAMSNFDQGSFTLRGFDLFKPIVAAVNGFCMAGGMELLGGTDIRIASADAVFSVSEVRRGLFAGGGTTARLPRQLAWPAAMELLLVADHMDAHRALQLGLVNEVVPREDLMDAARSWARRIAANAPIAVQMTKKSALGSLAVGSLAEAYAIEDACSDAVFRTEDAQEGAAAFIEKRLPVWRAR